MAMTSATGSLRCVVLGRTHRVHGRVLSNRSRSSSTDAKRNATGASSGLVVTASSYLASLRLRAASALTASLSRGDRDSLLRSINAVDESSAAEESRKSIGEAVAQAVAKEAERSEYKWKREKEEIVAKAQSAAMERVKHDLLIQQRRMELEQWQMKMKKEKEEGERMSRAEDAKVNREKLEDDRLHPILGPALIDLGYKRVHVASARALAAIPIWEKQRVYRHDRAKVMAADKLKSTDLGLPGIISLHEAEDGQLAILDGQHRVGMMALLQSKGLEADQLDLERVLVEVFPRRPPSAESHAGDIFTEINKAEPVKLVDMPGVAKKTDRNIINDAAQKLMDNFPDMFKPSQRCRSPHLNVDNLRDALFAADVLKRHNIRTSKGLVDWMSEKNQELGHLFIDGDGGSTATKVSKTALNKAVKFNFFLGLDSSWLYN